MGKYKKEMRRIFLALVILVGLVACSPVQRHARIVKNHPYVHTIDSVKLVDTIIVEVPKVEVDSVFQVDSFLIALHDTIEVTKDRLKIRIVKVHDSIFVDGKCDTIFVDKIIEKKVPVKYYETKADWKSYKNLGLLVLGIIILIIMLILIIKLLQVLK